MASMTKVATIVGKDVTLTADSMRIGEELCTNACRDTSILNRGWCGATYRRQW